jgi:hypothetical protein
MDSGITRWFCGCECADQVFGAFIMFAPVNPSHGAGRPGAVLLTLFFFASAFLIKIIIREENENLFQPLLD